MGLGVGGCVGSDVAVAGISVEVAVGCVVDVAGTPGLSVQRHVGCSVSACGHTYPRPAGINRAGIRKQSITAVSKEFVRKFGGPMLVGYKLGRVEESAPLIDELRARWPRPEAEIRLELIERHAISPALTDHLLEGLAKAGLDVSP